MGVFVGPSRVTMFAASDDKQGTGSAFPIEGNSVAFVDSCVAVVSFATGKFSGVVVEGEPSEDNRIDMASGAGIVLTFNEGPLRRGVQ
jgi:hypothetical protein